MAIATVHNGGRLVLNFSFPGPPNGEFPFLNLAKIGGSLKYISTNALVEPSDLDANGYSTISNKNGGYYFTTQMPSQADRPGNYVLKWDGIGTIYFGGTNTAVGGTSKTNTVEGQGRYVFTPGSAGGKPPVGVVSFSVKITNIRFCHVDDEADLDAGEIFGRKFLERLREGKFALNRDLNWSYGNVSNAFKWADRKPISYITWGSQEQRASIYAGATTNAGDDYAVSFGSGGPTDKLTFCFRFNASKTYPKSVCTFDIGASTVGLVAHGLNVRDPVGFGFNGGSPNAMPVPLYTGGNYYVSSVPTADTFTISATPGGAAITFSGTQSGTFWLNRQPTLELNSNGVKYPIKGQSGNTMGTGDSPLLNGYGTVTFDSGLGAWLLHGGGTNTGDMGGFMNGVPPEIFIQCCAEVGAHPWVLTPPYSADDTAMDYMTSYAQYIKDNGPAWMIPMFEPPNECFNTAGGFISNPYMLNKAMSLGWSNGTANIGDWSNYYGRAATLLGKAVHGVYGGLIDRSKYRLSLGVFTIQFNSGVSSLYDAHFTSAKYVTLTGDATDAARLWATHLHCSQYTVPYDYGKAQEVTYYDAWVGGSTTAISDYLETMISGTYTQFSSVAFQAKTFANIYTKATSFTNKDGETIRMCGYEGGPHNHYTSGGTGIDTFRAAAKLHEKWGFAMSRVYDAFLATGPYAEFPAYFQFGGVSPSGDCWSALETVYTTDDPPLWWSGRDFNNRLKRKRVTVSN